MNTPSNKKTLTIPELIKKLQKIEASLPFEGGRVGCSSHNSIYPTGVVGVEWDRGFNTAIIELESDGEDLEEDY